MPVTYDRIILKSFNCPVVPIMKKKTFGQMYQITNEYRQQLRFQTLQRKGDKKSI